MVKGSCLCRGFSFEVNGEFASMVDCHCSMCRKVHGAAFATFVGCATADYRVVQGQDLVGVYKSSEQGRRCFCKVCGSNLPLAIGEQVFLPAGLLDGDPGVRTSAHYFVGSKAPWVDIADDAPQHDEYPTG
jgi:hypothetical protein